MIFYRGRPVAGGEGGGEVIELAEEPESVLGTLEVEYSITNIYDL